MIILGEAKDLRPDYAAKLRELADMIEKAEWQPSAIQIFVFHSNDQKVTRLTKTEGGANFFTIGGALQLAANQILFQAGQSSG